MAVTKPSGTPSPAVSTLLSPLIPALTAAAVSSEPASTVLPLLSPILRQRVQFLSSSGSDPWLRLLCYDTSKAAKLAEIATNGSLDPHPSSGEIEVDWDHDCETRYRRLDAETLQAFVVLKELGLAFKLVHCIEDKEGAADGWRIGEVTVAEESNPFESFDGASPDLAAAEQVFEQSKAQQQKGSLSVSNGQTPNGGHHLTATNIPAEGEEDDDDDYWARYDNTPARTPAQAHSPGPQASGGPVGGYNAPASAASAEDDAYFSRYNDVQPAMDNHDPDEEAEQAHLMPPSSSSLGLSPQNNNAAAAITTTRGRSLSADLNHDGLLHPRPESSASSRASSQVIEKLEEEAGRKDQSDFGVKQHISRSIRSLFMLSRASGIEREEFEQLVKSELDVLGMVEEDLQ
ncbi:unnamed protein product [Clonostachys rosea]|uniref:Uncharacterized protein n=1 Tax=Bionectria ochroleuca TaxID=29856 RepID=A0ABY6URA6_BIOOC|nr:unnamed protein product [Clonostachys rosea]